MSHDKLVLQIGAVGSLINQTLAFVHERDNRTYYTVMTYTIIVDFGFFLSQHTYIKVLSERTHVNRCSVGNQ